MAKAQAQEPSMEEILASIRRIIADEESAPKGAAAKTAEPPPAETVSEDDLDKLFASAGGDEPEEDEDEDVLELTEEVGAGDPPLVEGFGNGTDLAFEEPRDDEPEVALDPEPEPEPEPAPVPPPKPAPVMRADPPPVVPAATVSRAAPEPAPPPPASEEAHLLSTSAEGMVSSAFNDLALTVLNRNARTLEDLVQDMLRPMLKTWLDQNLPGMVERMIRAEIDRVTRGR